MRKQYLKRLTQQITVAKLIYLFFCSFEAILSHFLNFFQDLIVFLVDKVENSTKKTHL